MARPNANTTRSIEYIRNNHANEWHTVDEWNDILAIENCCSFYTLTNHLDYEVQETEHVISTLTPQEMAEWANDCCGTDMWDCCYHWRVNADGNFENVEVCDMYRFC